MHAIVGSAIACLLVGAATPALALYRCGNVFQDKPCDSGPQIDLSPSGRPQAAPASPAARSVPPSGSPYAAVCARLGEHAQRIAWKREAGATQDQQLAERAPQLSPAEHANTVAAVYARRGSAPEMRAAVEAECIADKEREANAAELLRQLRRDAGETRAAPAAAPAPAAATAPAGVGNAAAPSSPGKPSASSCASLKRSVDDVRARLAQGGSSRQMESLQNERRSAEASLRASGCG